MSEWEAAERSLVPGLRRRARVARWLLDRADWILGSIGGIPGIEAITEVTEAVESGIEQKILTGGRIRRLGRRLTGRRRKELATPADDDDDWWQFPDDPEELIRA